MQAALHYFKPASDDVRTALIRDARSDPRVAGRVYNPANHPPVDSEHPFAS